MCRRLDLSTAVRVRGGAPTGVAALGSADRRPRSPAGQTEGASEDSARLRRRAHESSEFTELLPTGIEAFTWAGFLEVARQPHEPRAKPRAGAVPRAGRGQPTLRVLGVASARLSAPCASQNTKTSRRRFRPSCARVARGHAGSHRQRVDCACEGSCANAARGRFWQGGPLPGPPHG
jgi:hypothetical protein